MGWVPRANYLDWPEDATDLDSVTVQNLYAAGYAGATRNDAASAAFRAAMAFPDGDAVCHQFGLADSGAGKLVIPFVHVLELFPGCWPGPAQGRGDCVSHSSKNACLLTLACDVVSGQPDEKTGQPEERPDVSPEGIAAGVLSSEAIYWFRGYDGDGWHCPAAAQVCCSKGGVVLRKDYSALGIDLTKYSAKTAGKWGRTPPPANVRDMTDDHLIHQATEADSTEACRDLLANGYGVSTCGGEGWSDRRDENGYSDRQGSWAHAMACIGFDDRDIIKQTYKEPLMLILNSWATWNSGGRDILQSAAMVPAEKKAAWTAAGIVNASTGNIMIPEGSYWARASHCKNRELIAFSGAAGWPAKVIPWGTLTW